MRVVRVALSALGGVVLAASSALAADVAAVPPPPLWGFYFGGGVCYDWADFDIDKEKTFDVKKYEKITVPKEIKYWDPHTYQWKTITIYIPKWVPYWETITKEKHYDGKAEGPCLTATIGYDYPIDQLFLIGFFASYDWQDKSGDITKIKYGEPYTVPYSSVWLGNIATVAGRAGILVQPDLLVYALLGFSWSEGGIDLKGKELSGNLSGPTIGAGIEKIFASHWSGRLEYRLTDFGSLTGTNTCYFGKNCSETTTVGITDQSIRFVITYRP